jgi:drug/metabolite transporter (DMT)-like permease
MHCMNQSKQRPQTSGTWLLLCVPPLLWAGNFIVGRALRSDVPPAMLDLCRHLVAFLCLLPFSAKPMLHGAKEYWGVRWRIVGTAVTGMAAFNLLIYVGLHSTTASNALLLNSMIPVLIAVIGAVAYRQKLGMVQVAGLGISCFGVVVIIMQGQLTRLLSLQFSGGDLIVFLGMVSFAVYSLWLKKFPRDLNPVGLLGWQLAVAVLVLTPFCAREYMSGAHVHWTGSSLAGMGYVALGASLLATFTYMIGVSRVGPARAGLFIHLIPVYGAILSTVLLGESIRVYHFVGMAVIVAGLVCSSDSKSQSTAADRKQYG